MIDTNELRESIINAVKNCKDHDTGEIDMMGFEYQMDLAIDDFLDKFASHFEEEARDIFDRLSQEVVDKVFE